VNGDGKLSKEEIITGYDKYFGKQMSEDDVDALFNQVDADNSGFIDYSEFVVASMNEKNLLTNEKLEAAFKMFDKDGSGLITGDEIKEVMCAQGGLAEDAVKEIIKQVDDNGDGEISFEEFVQMMKSLTVA
jgi:calcium-dependent protein kinase